MNRSLTFLFAAVCCSLVWSPCEAADPKSMQGDVGASPKAAPTPQRIEVFPVGDADFEHLPTMDDNLLKKHIHASSHPESQKECKRLRGTWMKSHAGGAWLCDLPTPDAGKICRDDSECSQYCKPDRNSAWGKKSTGSCETHTYFLGCIHGMTHGKPTMGPCLN